MISLQLILMVVIANENCTVCLASLSVIELTAPTDTLRHNYSVFLSSLCRQTKTLSFSAEKGDRGDFKRLS